MSINLEIQICIANTHTIELRSIVIPRSESSVNSNLSTDSNSELLVTLNLSHYNNIEGVILWKQKI